MIRYQKGRWCVFPGLLVLTFVTLLRSEYTLADQRTVDDIDQADYLSEVPIVISATRLNQKITDVPASITIIDRELIEASGATEIPQIFQLAPGYLSYYVFGNQFGVTNKGGGLEFPGDLEIMIDGRSIYEPFFSAVEWSSLGITLDDVDHIEIVRGSNTPAYGSNAYLGAINIVSKSPLQTKGFSFHTTMGQQGESYASLRRNTQVNNIALSFGLTYRNNDGFPKRNHVNLPFDKIRDSNEALHFIFKGLYTPSLTDTLEFQLGLGKSTIDIPYPPPHGDIRGYNHRQFTNDFQLLRWRHNFNDENELRLQLSHNRLSMDEFRQLDLLSAIEGISPASVPLLFNGHTDEAISFDLRDTQSDRTDLELQHQFALGERLRLVWGAGVRYDWLQSQFLLGQSEAIDESQYRLFFNLEWCLHQDWTLNLGAMAENNNIVGNFISPRLALNYKISPKQVLHAAYTYGNRTPSTIEAKQIQSTHFRDGTLINTQFVFSKEIEESKVHEWEIGYRAKSWANKLSLDLRLFHTKANGVIGKYQDSFPDFDQSAFYISNTTNWTNQGFDTQIQWRPNNSSLMSLQYAYSDFTGHQLVQRNPSIVTALGQEIPRHNASLLISKTFQRDWTASLAGYYLSDIDWREGDFVAAHDRLDFRLAKEMHFGHNRAKIEVIVHNLLNNYSEFREINQFKTRVFARLSIDLP